MCFMFLRHSPTRVVVLLARSAACFFYFILLLSSSLCLSLSGFFLLRVRMFAYQSLLTRCCRSWSLILPVCQCFSQLHLKNILFSRQQQNRLLIVKNSIKHNSNAQNMPMAVILKREQQTCLIANGTHKHSGLSSLRRIMYQHDPIVIVL